ncbi:DUF892 family protein [Burkholderia metallica]|uniref:DUF892 family protein n=1 Tax=Burkholderia metallica TaxID=488729 RepID=A0ABT8PE26_9BURK|nr:DUF892 family protein [Burkholderia metallica]MDN7933126.1 DUF892 family protein [Burkholderia metallica]
MRPVAGGMLAAVEGVKGALAGHAFAQVRIDTYTALAAVAQAAGETEIRACRERIPQQARDMAAWRLRHLPALTASFPGRSSVDRIDATQ